MPRDQSPILLAEGNKRDARSIVAAIVDCKPTAQVIAAYDGREALDYLFARGAYSGEARGNAVAVILNLKLPRIDGIQVLQTIKSRAFLRKIPVVMLANSAVPEEVSHCYGLGANAFVVRPPDSHDFRTALDCLSRFWVRQNEAPPVPGPRRYLVKSRVHIDDAGQPCVIANVNGSESITLSISRAVWRRLRVNAPLLSDQELFDLYADDVAHAALSAHDERGGTKRLILTLKDFRLVKPDNEY